MTADSPSSTGPNNKSESATESEVGPQAPSESEPETEFDFRPLRSRAIERPTDVGYTLVAGLDGVLPARVDGGGAVATHGAGWSVDWWVGADDRWHLPAREPSVRQRRIGFGPVIETSLRVPSGDVVQTVYPVMVGGRNVTAIEIKNDSPVPVALAIAIRPYGLPDEGQSEPGSLRVALDKATVMVDGQVGVVLPRPPNESGASDRADLVAAVRNGEPLEWRGEVSGPGANAVCMFPLPHKTSLRFVVPGLVDGPVAVDSLSDSAASARGWTAVVERAARFEFPDPGVSALAGAARARMLVGAEQLPGRLVGAAPGAGVTLASLAVGGHQVECGWSLDALAQSFPTKVHGDPMDAASVVAGAATAAELVGDLAITEGLLEPMAQLTHLVERAGGRRNREAAGPAAEVAKAGLATLADLTGQAEAAAELRVDRPGPVLSALSALAPKADLDRLMAMGAEAAPAGRWNPGDSMDRAARYWLAARRFLVDQGAGPGTPLELLPVFPTAWRGGTVEVHRAPVAGTRVSFAIRWHGYRPALLWDIDPGRRSSADETITVTCPGLDPAWSTDELKGETLLAGVAEELPEAPAPGESFG